MHILVTNDDGIESLGLWLLAQALHEAGLGDVTIIAPDGEQSGMSMAFPPRLEHELNPASAPEPGFAAIRAYTLNGTPVNCVTVGMLGVVNPRPDVVVSGINRGLNAGTNVLLSGTVGAAMIASLWGVPALAVSAQWVRDTPMAWEVAAWAATRVLPLLHDLPRVGSNAPLLNVNVPNVPSLAALRGFRQTGLSNFFYGTFIRMGEGQPTEQGGLRFRYTFDRSAVPDHYDEGSDDGAIRAGYVAVTALTPIGINPALDLRPALLEL
ncbi:MAG: 5'/3'-nucleotidase SurE [Chloroflexaceae bacterium]|nr:5'/3'-nucleotidase SurE [Chloroflexaceae bacterium]